jgi:hypothetical protein
MRRRLAVVLDVEEQTVGDSVRHQNRNPPRSTTSARTEQLHIHSECHAISDQAGISSYHRVTEPRRHAFAAAGKRLLHRALSAVRQCSRGYVPSLTSPAEADTGSLHSMLKIQAAPRVEAFSGQFKPLPKTLRTWVRICRPTQMNTGAGHVFQRCTQQ